MYARWTCSNEFASGTRYSFLAFTFFPSLSFHRCFGGGCVHRVGPRTIAVVALMNIVSHSCGFSSCHFLESPLMAFLLSISLTVCYSISLHLFSKHPLIHLGGSMVLRSWLLVHVNDRDDPNRGAVAFNGQLEARYASE